MSCVAPTAPANDLVCNSTPITCGQTISGTTVDATNSGTAEAGFCSISQTQPGVWYTVPGCLLYTSPSPRDVEESRMPSSA